MKDNVFNWIPDTTSIRDRLADFRLSVFGSEHEFLLFVGALLYFSTFWRIGIFVTDNWTIANTLVAIADGHLYVEQTVYGPPAAETPGYHLVEGHYYGRNYGQLFLALPGLFLVEILAQIVDLRIALAGAWSLGLLVISKRIGDLLRQPRGFTVLGVIGALGSFAVNTGFALPLEPRWHALMGLQLTNMVFAAAIGVLIYRLTTRIHDRRSGIFVGVTTVVATPIAFWAPIPKRHIIGSFLALLTLYSFHRSRMESSPRKALQTRCLAYVSVGIWAWIHAPEALAMFAVLLPLDLVTARDNSLPQVATVGSAFLASLMPFFLTNFAISGNPLVPPRLLSRGPPAVTDGSATGSQSIVSQLLGPVSQAFRPFETLTNLYVGGIVSAITDPAGLVHTFIVSAPATTRATATDLTLLEATPIFAVFLGVIWIVVKDWSGGFSIRPISGTRATDLFAGLFVLSFTLLYLSRLPLHAMWTVRYLLPIVPFGMYFIGRLESVRSVASQDARLLIYSYTGLVFIGGQFLLVFLVGIEPTRGVAIQIHGKLGLIAAAITGVWVTTDTFGLITDSRLRAVVLSIPLAAGTLFVLMAGLEYFVVGDFALAGSQLLSEAIPLF